LLELGLVAQLAFGCSVDIATVARAWTMDFTVLGSKTEPTFVEHVEYGRLGDRFILRGDIAGDDLGVTAYDVTANGVVSVVACPASSECTSAPNGFLSTVMVVAAARAGRLHGSADLASYAGRQAMCVPLEAIQPRLNMPVVLDPCFDVATGAVLAHRRRYDGQFGGAALDESSLQIFVNEPGG